MPTYVYECPNGHTEESVRKIAERDGPLLCCYVHCFLSMKRVEIAGAPAYVTRPGVGDRSPFSRDRAGK